MKIYFKTYVDDNWIYFKNSENNILIRFAGKPQFLLEESIRKYWKKEGIEFYDKMTDLFLDISKRWFSPIVAYLYGNKKNNGRETFFEESEWKD